MNNSPINYTDPTGHRRVADGPRQDRFSKVAFDKYVPLPPPPPPEPEKLLRTSASLNFGLHLGPEGNAPMPEYNGETQNSANVPYISDIIPSNQDPNVCAGGSAGAISCFIALGNSVALNFIPSGPTNTDPNFFVSFIVSRNGSGGVTWSDLHWANQYSGQAVIKYVAINDEVLKQRSAYIPSDGSYYPVEGSGGTSNGNRCINNNAY